jgi:hypothetical protein
MRTTNAMRWGAGAVAALVIMALSASPAEAQSALPEPGDTTRVRSAQRSGRWQSGVVVSADAGSVRFIRAENGDTVSYAVGPLDRWDVTRGSDNHPIRGLLFGAGVGAVAGGIAFRVVAGDGGFGYGPEDVLIGAGIGAAVGAGVGALIGSARRTPRWEPVIRPAGGGAAGVSLDF